MVDPINKCRALLYVRMWNQSKKDGTVMKIG
jgi:hypothetical protein